MDMFDQELKGNKDILKQFKNYVIEVKINGNKSFINIYDFENKMSMFKKDFAGNIL